MNLAATESFLAKLQNIDETFLSNFFTETMTKLNSTKYLRKTQERL